MPIIDNAVTLLKKDHLMVKGLFKSLKALDKLDIGGRETLFNSLKRELDIHAHIEETIFYPAVREANKETEDIIAHSYDDHATVKELLETLEQGDKGSKEWSNQLETLEKNVEEHVKEEEEMLLPQAEKILGEERLKQLGEQIHEEKDRLKEENKE